MTADPKVEGFWRWFASVASEIAADPTEARLVSAMDARVGELGPFAWEIGPGIREPWQFVVSPGGNPDLLTASRAVVSEAPAVPGWEFHASKQPRRWSLEFSILDHEGVKRTLTARGWRYLLLQYGDGDFRLVMRAPELMVIPVSFRRMAVEICLDGLIGELPRLRLFQEIDVCSEFEEPSRGKGIAVEEMPAHLRSLGLL